MSIQSVIANYRSQLVTQAATAEHSIQAAHNHMLAAVMPHVSALLKEYKSAQSGDEKVPLHWLYTGNRLQSVKHAVSQNVSQFGTQAKAQVVQLQGKAVALGTESAHAQLGTVSHTVKPVPAHATDKLAAQQSKPIGALMGDYGVDASDRVGKVLVTSVSLGRQPDTIDKLIMSVLLMSLYRSITLNRTAEMMAYRESVLLTFQVNDDTAQGWLWRALGPHPCVFCTKMDGTRHTLDETMDSHPNCFCIQELIALGA